mgnify:FL=1
MKNSALICLAAAVMLLAAGCTPPKSGSAQYDGTVSAKSGAQPSFSGASGSASSSGPDYLEPNTDPAALENYTGAEAAKYVKTSPEQELYAANAGQITVLLHNSGDKTFSFGKEYRVERQTTDGWEALPFRDDHMIPAIGILLPPGAEQKETYSLEDLAASLEPGNYRLSIGMTAYQVYCPFQLGN